jgi:hypothetical protein
VDRKVHFAAFLDLPGSVSGLPEKALPADFPAVGERLRLMLGNAWLRSSPSALTALNIRLILKDEKCFHSHSDLLN